MSSPRVQVSPKHSPKVAIIGGGLAGLSAARYLQEKKIDYVIFEGTNRVGGRVYPEAYKNGFLQYGAQFINGQKNPMYEIASRIGIIKRNMPDDELYGDDVVYACGNSPLTKDDLDAFRCFTTPLQDKYEDDSVNDPFSTIGKRFDVDYEKWINEDISRVLRRPIFDSLAKIYKTYYENEWCAPADQLALKNLQQWDDYSNVFASYTLGPIGFKAILDELVSFVDNQRIRYNSAVTKIDYQGTTCRLTLSSGPVYETFDYVIVTASIGHLKHFHKNLFVPQLPKWKSKAIESIGMGNMMKVFLEYEKPFWAAGVGSILALPIDNCSDDKETKIKNSLRVFQPLEWDNNTLVCWIAGDGPSYLSGLTDEQLVLIVTDRLRESMANPTIPLPIQMRRVDWYGNPLFLGSYSFLTPEAVKMGNAYQKMADPVMNGTRGGKPQILFAGEATHNNLYQTTSGAYLSGQREATRICKLEGI